MPTRAFRARHFAARHFACRALGVVIDWHAACRDAVASQLDGIGWSLTVYRHDDFDDLRVLDLPAITCVPIGPESDRPEMTTNRQDGIGYPVLVGLMTAGVTSGERSPNTPTLTLFRRFVQGLFHNQRLPGVRQIGWCEVDGRSPVFDKDSPAFQKIQTSLVVTCIGRFPRG